MTDDEGLDALMSTPARPEGDAVAWQWRACISGRWGSWLNVDQPIERFCERNGDHLESGIFELRPLYASPPPASAGVREALEEIARESDIERSGPWNGMQDRLGKIKRIACLALVALAPSGEKK